MAISSNTSITLNAHSPKKAATVATDGSHTTGVSDVTIWAASGVNVGNPNAVIATFKKLRAYALSHLGQMQPSAGPTVVHGPIDPSDGAITIDGVPVAADCRIEIGSTIVDNQQSHFIDRTITRLLEVLREGSTGAAAAAVANVPEPMEPANDCDE